MYRVTKSCSLLLLLLSLIAAPRDAAALEVGLEIETGTGITLGPFPDGVPISIDDPAGALFAGIPDSAYNVLVDMQPSVGFSGGMTLLLGHWYIRAALTWAQFSSVTLTRYAFRRVGGQEVPEELHNVYVGELDQEDDVKESIDLLTTRLGFGHRWYFVGEGPIRPYLPMGLGAMVALIDGEAQWGMTFHLGLGVDIHINERFDLGVRAQYEWMGVFLPDNFQASTAGSSITSLATSGNSALEALMESWHTLQLTATATYRF